MELSTTNNIPGVVLNDESMKLIKQLIILDTAQRETKKPIYERLYELWVNDLTTASNAKQRFNENRSFIKKLIFETLPEKSQKYYKKIDSICETLKRGNPWTNPEDNAIIPYNDTEIIYYEKRRKSNNQNLNNRVKAICEEFHDYIINKNNEEREQREIFQPHQLVLPTRKSIGRKSKSNALEAGFVGLAASEGKKKTSRVIESDEVIYILKYIYLLIKYISYIYFRIFRIGQM